MGKLYRRQDRWLSVCKHVAGSRFLLRDGLLAQPSRQLMVVALALLLGSSAVETERERFSISRIAHAGGAVDGQVNLNSIAALDRSLEKGFRYFELDFIFTEDNRIVCLRDWGEDFFSVFGFYTDRPLSYAEFEDLSETLSAKVRRCDQFSLLKWVKENPSLKIVTDFKERNLQGLSILSNVFPRDSVIPQVYSLEDYDLVKGLGFDKVIWTLYRSNLTDDEVVRKIKDHRAISVVAMPVRRADRRLPLRLSDYGVSTYIHTVNSVSDYYYYRLKGVSEIYSDLLYPDELNDE